MDKFDQVEFNSVVSIVLFGEERNMRFFKTKQNKKCPSQIRLL